MFPGYIQNVKLNINCEHFHCRVNTVFSCMIFSINGTFTPRLQKLLYCQAGLGRFTTLQYSQQIRLEQNTIRIFVGTYLLGARKATCLII